MAKPVHVISKLDNAKHAVVYLEENLRALAASSVRVRPGSSP